MEFRSPIDASFTPLAWDKFGVIRPRTIDPSGKAHTGVDLRPHENGGSRWVKAAADGQIVASTDKQGSYYMIDHGGGWFTLYVHMRTPRPLPIGAIVKQGDPIGTYNSPMDNHLHFMIRKNGEDLDPEQFINFNQNPKMTKSEMKIAELEKAIAEERARANAEILDLRPFKPALTVEREQFEKDMQIAIDEVTSLRKSDAQLRATIIQLTTDLTKLESDLDVVNVTNEALELKTDEQTFSFQKLFLGITKKLVNTGAPQGIAGSLATIAVGYLTAQIPELAPYTGELMLLFGGLTTLAVGSQNIHHNAVNK